jgi:hypothetical protein
MDGTGDIILSKINKTVKDKYHVLSYVKSRLLKSKTELEVWFKW